MKVAVVGASGFIAKKLIEELSYDECEVMKVGRDTSFDSFSKILRECDFCFHLAGEVRPNASEDEFFNTNVEYTKKIIDELKLNLKKPPIFFTSTVHAENRTNAYGKSKFLAEKIIEDYNNITGNVNLNYRLTHLFGAGAKPNHNSVFTTWVYNALSGKPLEVFNENYLMHYIQIDELVSMMVKIAETSLRHELPTTYNVTLGELKSKILSLVEGCSPRNKFDSYIVEMINDAKAHL